MSHYVEKVRWILDYIGEPYIEEQDMGILCILLVSRSAPRLKNPGLDIMNSSDILNYLHGRHFHDKAKSEFLIRSSEAIEWEMKFDHLGELNRYYVYYHLLNREDLLMNFWGYDNDKVPIWQRIFIKPLTPVLKKILVNLLKENRKYVRSLQKSAYFLQSTHFLVVICLF